MDKLREKIAAIVRSAAFPASDAVAEICEKTAELAADRILAMPEIAGALGKCCDGGPQWGHAIDCPKCPD